MDEVTPKAILRTTLDRDADLNEVTIDPASLPDILTSLLDDPWSPQELETLLSAQDTQGRGKLDLSQASQVLLHFLKKSLERRSEFCRVSLRICTTMTISGDEAAVVVCFYPQLCLGEKPPCVLQ